MSGRTATLVTLLLVIAVATCGPAAQATPRKLGFDDLPGSLEKPFWDRVDRYAGFAALLKLCGRPVDFEHRFVAAVQACVEPQAIQKTVTTYRGRFAHVLSHAKPHPCEDPFFIQNSIPDKLTQTLDGVVSQAALYCQGYLLTGTYGQH